MTEDAAVQPEDDPIQVSLLTGFLGSGKTTLLNRLLRHEDMSETAVLINEFGDIGIDHSLVENVDENTVQLTTGCLCCAVQGDLTRALQELFLKRVRGKVPRFKRVLIETTGLADPAPILHTLINDPIIATRYFLDGVIATVDALWGLGQLDRHPEPRKQTAVADRIVLTKCDLAAEADIKKLEERIHALNPAAPIIRSVEGDVPPSALFGCGLYDPDTKSFDVREWLKEEAYREPHDHDHDHGHDHDHDHRHRHDEDRHGGGIDSFCMTRDEPLNWPTFVTWIQTLIDHRGEDILRIKGILNIEGEEKPIAIHGVQHMFHSPVRLPDWPGDDHRTKIVFITRDLDRKVIEDSLEALNRAAETQEG